MASGKKPENPLLESDTDLLDNLPVIQAYAGGAALEADTPIREMTAISFARIAEGAVHQHRKNLPNGKVSEFVARAQKLMENAIAEECFSAGERWCLASLCQKNEIGREALSARWSELAELEDNVRRNAAIRCAEILGKISLAISRKGQKGRPIAAKSDDKLSLWDTTVLRDAISLAAPGLENDRSEISEKIPVVVRAYIRLGQLPWRGEPGHLQDCVDIHTERVRRLLDNIPNSSRSYRGFSIKRRVP